MALDDPYTSYCFDEAIAHIGTTIENEMDKASKDAKTDDAASAAREAVLKRYLAPKSSTKSGFADPALMFS